MFVDINLMEGRAVDEADEVTPVDACLIVNNFSGKICVTNLQMAWATDQQKLALIRHSCLIAKQKFINSL
tara:strand:- start:464 stop:673 length:210 start_codon:yes stop_codon:yes gene_type:complete